MQTPVTHEPETLYKIREASELLRVTTKTVYRWTVEGRIRTVRMGRAVRVPASEIDRIIREGLK